ncbi:hypothetical protein DPMN_168765 [Dreissena polymorpha]|uniref:Uncharacterized protein n=1 Tax=Dreissena polymorpha TaxID=45954 RepID=A0A9D4IZY1_DREPO|nr:hypothetical protein DPMN_168765 [Dreissena polymorpha]
MAIGPKALGPLCRQRADNRRPAQLCHASAAAILPDMFFDCDKPCSYKGRSYEDGAEFKEECNTCRQSQANVISCLDTEMRYARKVALSIMTAQVYSNAVPVVLGEGEVLNDVSVIGVMVVGDGVVVEEVVAK